MLKKNTSEEGKKDFYTYINQSVLGCFRDVISSTEKWKCSIIPTEIYNNKEFFFSISSI